MRIAYIANFQGPRLVEQRSIKRNRSLAGTQKIACVAKCLAVAGADVEIFSSGVAVEGTLRIYPSFQEELSSKVRATYAACLDFPNFGQLTAALDLARRLVRRHKECPFDVIVLYNCGLPEAVCYWTLGWSQTPVILEYEDDVRVMPNGSRTWKNLVWTMLLGTVRRRLSGVVSPSFGLLAQFSDRPTYLLRGIIDTDFERFFDFEAVDEYLLEEIVFAGSLTDSKGVDKVCRALAILRVSGWPNLRLRVFGGGVLLDSLRSTFASDNIQFEGVVSRDHLMAGMKRCAVLVNPHLPATLASRSVFPFKIVEYLATGRPVVSTPLPDLQTDERFGICFAESDEPADLAAAIGSVLKDYAIWIKRAKSARAVVLASYGERRVAVALTRFLGSAGCWGAAVEASTLL